jgi:quinolinate synthase
MGAWLNYQYGYDMPVWNAVCEVHDQFKEAQINTLLKHSNKGKLIAHPESPLPVLKRADFVGSTKQMLDWIRQLEDNTATVYVATEEGLLHNMKHLRPDLDIQQAPTYSGCQCNACPYMKRNTPDLVKQAQQGKGFQIDYLDDTTMQQARQPIERMLTFSTPL